MSRRTRRLARVFGGAGALAGLVLAVVWPIAGTEGLAFELCKTCIQVMGVALLGGVASIAAAEYQRERIERFETAKLESEHRHEVLTRHDEFIRSLLRQSIDTYNDVKRVRRRLQALAGPVEHRRPISAASYQEAISSLNDAQLTFESLKRTSTLTGIEGLRSDYRAIEKHLDAVLDQDKESLARGEDVLPTEDTALYSLLYDITDFRANVSVKLRDIVQKLQSDLLTPRPPLETSGSSDNPTGPDVENHR